MKYHRGLMQVILHDKAQIAKAVNATVITPRRRPAGLQGLRQGRGQEVRDRPARARSSADPRRPAPRHARGAGGAARPARAAPRGPAPGQASAGITSAP